MSDSKPTLRPAIEAAKISASNSARDTYLDARIIEAIDKASHSGRFQVELEKDWMMKDANYVINSLRSLGYQTGYAQEGLNEYSEKMTVSWKNPQIEKLTLDTVKVELQKIVNHFSISERQSDPGSLSQLEREGMRGRNAGRAEVRTQVEALLNKF
jgi:hypothetical protein